MSHIQPSRGICGLMDHVCGPHLSTWAKGDSETSTATPCFTPIKQEWFVGSRCALKMIFWNKIKPLNFFLKKKKMNQDLQNKRRAQMHCQEFPMYFFPTPLSPLGNLQLRVIIIDSIPWNLEFICFFLSYIILKHWAKRHVFAMSRTTGMDR